jgi:16S rRNA (guanine966-N2)-methyltransferase
MNVVRGKYRGLKLDTLEGDNTRPTTTRVKEAIFSMLNNHCYDAMVLDLFAGSASLGIEALSNNAKNVDFVEVNKDAIKVIKKNLDKIKDNNYHLFEIDYQEALKKLNKKYDLVFLDPPYKLHLINDILDDLVKYDLLSEDAIIVCESEISEEVYDTNNLEVYKEKKYGNTIVRLMRRK